MIGPPPEHVWIAAGITDLRRGFTGLGAAVQTVLEQDPFGGHVFVFRGRRGDLKSETAAAISYALGRSPALVLYCDDGLLEIDNNAAERSLRAVALGRKNYLFRRVRCRRRTCGSNLQCHRLGQIQWARSRSVSDEYIDAHCRSPD